MLCRLHLNGPNFDRNLLTFTIALLKCCDDRALDTYRAPDIFNPARLVVRLPVGCPKIWDISYCMGPWTEVPIDATFWYSGMRATFTMKTVSCH
jgi:hypothetical protein